VFIPDRRKADRREADLLSELADGRLVQGLPRLDWADDAIPGTALGRDLPQEKVLVGSSGWSDGKNQDRADARSFHGLCNCS
jgi:hypothetical protein